MDDKPTRRGFHPVYLLLLVPYVALLWVPFYNRIDPRGRFTWLSTQLPRTH